MDKTLRNAIIGGIVIITISVVYYFIYKPTRLESIRKECASTALNKAKDKYEKTLVRNPDGTTFRPLNDSYDGYHKVDYESYLSSCLQGNGIFK